MCLLFLTPTAIAADKGIFYILDEKFIDNISELPESTNITSDKAIQGTDGSLVGWIDIVGFRNMTHEDGVDYVPGTPADNAIVRGDAEDTGIWADCGNLQSKHAWRNI